MADAWLDISSAEYDSHCGDESGYTIEEALDGTDFWYHSTNHTHWFIIDLGQTYTIKKVRGRSNYGSYDPTDVDIYIDDNNPPVTLVHENITTWQDTDIWSEIDIADSDGRYIKVNILATENGPRALVFGKASPFMTIFDAYGDVAAGGATSYLTPSDDANASDNIVFNAGKNLSDNAKASDNVNFWTGRLHNIGDTAKAADSIVFNAGRKPSDNPKSSDGLAFNAGWHTSDNPKSSDGVAVNAGIPIADNPKSNDGIVFNAGKNLSDNPKASDTLVHAIGVFLSDTAKAADTIAYNVDKILSDTAKAIDRIAYVPPMIIRDLLRRPLRAIRDYRQKYTKQDMEKEKYHVIKDSRQKYTKQDMEKEKYHVSKKEDFKYKVEKEE